MTGQYVARFVACRRSVSLVEVSATESVRTVSVCVGRQRAEVELPIWYTPSVAFLPAETTAVWAVDTLYLLRNDRSPLRIEFTDEIHAVYGIDGALCVVGELSVLIYDSSRGIVVDEYSAEDVLGESWWEGERLIVEGIGGLPIVFCPTATAVGYVPN